MPSNVSGKITTANVSQSVFSKAQFVDGIAGYQIQNTSTAVLYVEDGGGAATTLSWQVAAGGFYQSPDDCRPALGVQIMGATAGQTFVAKLY